MSKPKIFNTRWKPYSVSRPEIQYSPDSKHQTKCLNVMGRPCTGLETGGTAYKSNDWLNDLCQNGTIISPSLVTAKSNHSPLLTSDDFLTLRSEHSSLSFDDLDWNEICGPLTEQSLFPDDDVTEDDTDCLKMYSPESQSNSPFTPFDLEDLDDNVLMDFATFPTPPVTPAHQVANSIISPISDNALMSGPEANNLLPHLQIETPTIAIPLTLSVDDFDEEPEMLSELPTEALNELCDILDSTDHNESSTITCYNYQEEMRCPSSVESVIIEEGYAQSSVSESDSIDNDESSADSVNKIISNDHVYAQPSIIPVMQEKPTTSDILQLLNSWYGFTPATNTTNNTTQPAAAVAESNSSTKCMSTAAEEVIDKASERRIKNNVASRVTRAKRRSKHEKLFITEVELQRKNRLLKQQIVDMQKDAELMRAILLKKLSGAK